MKEELQIEERVKKVVAEHFNVKVSDINSDITFKSGFRADSLDLVEIIINIEDKFCIEIPDGKEKKFNTINKIVECVKKEML